MQAIIKIYDSEGTSELKLTSLDELGDKTANFDRAGIDYTIEFKKI